MDISVVITVCPAHHRDEVLGRCLRGVAEQTLGLTRLEVILVGDGVELDPSLVPPGLSARRHSFPTPVGISRVRNQALRLATGELVAFVDADGVPHRDWLLRLRDRLTEEAVAACGGTTRRPHGRGDYEDRITTSRYILPCAAMTNVLFRKAVLDEIGGFDEALCFGAEEPDLCWRVCLKGHRFAYASDAIVTHRTHFSTRKFQLYGRALRQLERKFGAVLDISRRAELRVITDFYRLADAGDGELTLAQRSRLLAIAWGYGCAWVAELAGRARHIRPIDLTERTLQAQREVPALAAAVDGQTLIKPNHVLWWTSERGCCLLNLATRTRVELEDVAAEMWMGLMRGDTLADVRIRLEREYDVTPATLAADIEELLRTLLAHGMLHAARRAAALQLHDAFAKSRGEVWMPFQGRSMAPTLRDGDLLRVRHVAPDELAFGDIVVFDVAQARLVHRLLCAPRLRTRLLTKGDNVSRPDRPFATDCLVGKVCTVRRGAVRIEVERGRWRWRSRTIALASLLEAGAVSLTVAVRRRWFPHGLARRGVERRVLRRLGRCRRVVIGALLRTVPHVEAR